MKKKFRKVLTILFGGAGVASLSMGFILSLSNEGAKIFPDGIPLDTVWPWFLAIPIFLFLAVLSEPREN
jgi:hypothetical protein